MNGFFLSTLISITWAIGFAIGSHAVALQSMFEKSYGYSSPRAFQTVMVIFGGISLILYYYWTCILRDSAFTNG